MKKKILMLLVAATLYNLKPAMAQKPAYEMMVEGVKVIVQPSGNGIVDIQTAIKGGVQNYPADKQGIESLTMNCLTECGTTKHDKNTFKNMLDKVSAQVYSSTYKDYSVLSMNCIKTDFDTVWPLYVEALKDPAFDPKEFARVKQDAITALQANESQPDASINTYANKVAFAGRDYAKNPNGTAEIMKTLTLEDVKNYYKSVFLKSRLTIVIVADLDKSEIESKVKALLTGVKAGSPYQLKKSFFRVYKNTFASEPKELATNYIVGITSGPEPGTPDYDAFLVAMRIFYDRHFLEVRTNNGLSYAPGATFNNGSLSYAKFTVSTTQPDKYISVFDQLVDKVKHQGFTNDEVKNMKATYLTSFYYKQETNGAQASSMLSNEVIHNNWKRSLTLADDVKKLTTNQVSDAFRKYIGNIVWVYQGDTKKVNPLLYTNGTLNKADNPVSH
ncbi:M16 family metallopeptidase [Mucilaginibacter sp. KACC 22063]|uniref:M16 family metallopeptidase n=1 Tax=Mucilaginibacter sp. KACC 22063 TaxID=3025666 RepID=UPI00236567BB|nr:pitrilysin family protein [Mucilaginibacter sp. KACC 22063]WDF54537.1 pitrilysin family protein [Mucilaginibacter sp. KACC 22063]